MTTSRPTAKRTPKTPQQRAEAAFGVADRHFARLKGRRDKLAADLKVADAELEHARVRREFLAKDPDLGEPRPAAIPATAPSTTTTGDTTT